MSSEKTTFYGLHRWQKDDDFLREEFNENFAILDDRILRVVTGSYTCDGVDGRLIELGFEPKAVLVLSQAGVAWGTGSGREYYGGMALPGAAAKVYSYNNLIPNLEIVPTGFKIYAKGTAMTNVGGERYFLAFR